MTVQGIAQVQIVDLNQDGVQEIVRIGEDYYSAWEGLAKVEQEMGKTSVSEIDGSYEGPRDLSEVISGYEVVYRFKEIYFWNKDFNHYIQYTARITKDTTAEEVDWESVSIPSG